MKNHSIILSEEELIAVKKACDLMIRVMLGQSAEIAQYLPLTDLTDQWDIGRAIEKVTKPHCGLTMTGSWGYGKFKKADLLINLLEKIDREDDTP